MMVKIEQDNFILPLNTFTLNRSRLRASSALKLHLTNSYKAWGGKKIHKLHNEERTENSCCRTQLYLLVVSNKGIFVAYCPLMAVISLHI